MTPGVVSAVTQAPHLPKDDANTGPLVSFARSGIAAYWKASAYQSILKAGRGVRRPGLLVVSDRCLSQLRAVWFRARSSTDRSHSKSPPTATFSFAAHNRFATSSSICEA